MWPNLLYFLRKAIMNVGVIKLMFIIGIIGTVLALKMNNYVKNLPSTGEKFVFIRFPQKSGISQVLGEKFTIFWLFIIYLKKKLDKTHK